MKPDVDIKIVPAKEDDFMELARFMHKYFFPEEPLNSSLQRRPDPEDIPFMDVLKEGLSFKAVNTLDNTEDALAGVVINKEVSLEKKAKKKPATCPKTLKIHKLLEELDERSKVWEVVNNENHFEVLAVSVNNKYRGLGIGQKLVEASLELAKSLKYNYVSIECSSFYSARFAVQMGFELLKEIPYDEYLDENNEQIFKTNKPHVSIKKLIKRL